MYFNKSLTKNVARWALAALLLPAVVAGCSRPTGTLSGQVTLKGKPLPAGSVTFLHADGTTTSGSIQNGNYSIAKIPTGPCTVLVVSVPPPRSMWNPEKNQSVGGDGAADPFRNGMRIPARYGDPKQSDLHREVTSGSQTYDIDLKP